MQKQDRDARLSQAIESARKLQIRNAGIMLEGLALQMKEFDYRTEKDALHKGNRVLAKICLVQHTLDSVKPDKATEKEFDSTQKKKPLASTGILSAITGVCAAMLLKLPVIVPSFNLPDGPGYKATVLAFTSFFAISLIKDAFREARGATFTKLRDGINETLQALEKEVEQCLKEDFQKQRIG